MTRKSKDPPLLLTVKRVAELLQCSEKTVRRRIQSGELKASPIGRQYRIRLEDLEDFLGCR